MAKDLTGIGVLGFFTTLGLISLYTHLSKNYWDDKHKELLQKMEGLERKITEIERPYQLQIRNAIGKETPDKFYEINGQKVYVEIDGKPVAEYLNK